jgi:ATP-dependent DNA helicase RecG
MLTESKTIELKREYVDDIKKTITAFANTDGGQIFIGVEDDGTVCGIRNTDNVIQQVTNSIRDSIRPDITLFTECFVEVIEEKNVVVVNVQRGTSRPYYIAGKGIRPEGVFVRQGTSTVPATETAILNMIKETSGDCYEDARSLNQQLTFEKTAAYFAKKDIPFETAQMKTLNLIGSDNMYTNLALLLSDQCVHTIKLAIFEGSRKTIFKERREFSGSLLHQLEDAFEFIDLCNKTRAEFEGLNRIDMRDYPPEAIREALLNSVVHREYSYGGSTLISIFDDRMEFVTIGGLVKGISYNDIMLGVSVLRNQHLANVFYRLKLIEAYGTGVPKIMECYDNENVKPQVEVSDNAFKITLPNTNYAHEAPAPKKEAVINEKKENVMRLFENREFFIRKDVETALGISQATAISLLREMLDDGLIKKSTQRGNRTKYKAGMKG